MTNRKQATTYLAIVGMALLVTVMTMSSPAQVLALGHWNLDEDYISDSGFTKDGRDSSDATANTNEEEADNSNEDSIDAATKDEDEEEDSKDSNDESNAEEDSSNVAYDDLQACLSDAEGEGFPTEQEAQDCIESSYGKMYSIEDTSAESADDDDEDNEDSEE
jgi:hypothetical protein